MIFLVSAVVLVLCILVGVFTKRDIVWPFVLGALAVTAMIVAVLIPASVTPNGRGMNPLPDTNIGSSSLMALGNTSEISGSFFLGTGTVDEEQVYVYMADTDLGAEMLTVSVRKARIVEGEGEPHIEHLVRCDNAIWVPWPTCSRALLVFHIPPGSITRDFTIAP